MDAAAAPAAWWRRPAYDDPRDTRWRAGEPTTSSAGRNHQDLPLARIVALGLQHTAAVLFSTCGAVLVVVADGACRCGGVECAEPPEMEPEAQHAWWLANVDNRETCYIKWAADANYLVSMAVFCGGVSTCLQSGRVGAVGSNLLSIMGTSVVFLGVLMASGRLGGPEDGIGLMMGMSAATCWFETALAYLVPKKLMLRLQHPTILGSIVAVIGIDVLSRAIQMWGVEPRQGGGAALHAAIGLGSLLLLASFVRSGGGEDGKPPSFVYNISVLLTLIIASAAVGLLSLFVDEFEGRLNFSPHDPDGPGPLLSPCATYARANGMVLVESAAALTAHHAEAATAAGQEVLQLGVCAPLIDLSPLATAEWFTFPFQRSYSLRFDAGLLAPWLVATLASTLETMGDITATARLSGKRTDGAFFAARMRGGLNGDAVGSFISAVVGTLPNTTFSQNNGLISLTGAHDYRAGVAAGVLLMLIGVFSKFAGCLRSVPLPVMGGVFSVLFALVALSGVRMICESNDEPEQEQEEEQEEQEEEQAAGGDGPRQRGAPPRRALDSTRNQFIVAASLGVGVGTSMNAYSMNHTTLGYASVLSDSLAASTLLSNGVSVASLVAVGLSCLLPPTTRRDGGGSGSSGSGGGDGRRGYAQLGRESIAVPVDGSDTDTDDDAGRGTTSRETIKGGQRTETETERRLNAEVERLRAECQRLQRLLLAKDEGVGEGDGMVAAGKGSACP
jgi:xanthine/uracil permease